MKRGVVWIMLEKEVSGTVCTFWKSFWDLERNPPRHRPLRFYSPGERDRASYSVFYKTKHPQCYDLFCKTPKTSSQESKEPPTLHFNFQQKTFTTLNYYRCWLFEKKTKEGCMFCLLWVDSKFNLKNYVVLIKIISMDYFPLLQLNVFLMHCSFCLQQGF